MAETTKNSAQERRIAELEAAIQSLNEELAETNHGVVALYGQLEDMNQQLAEVSELKSRFLSYMSHEFRTPLGSILSIAAILLREMDGPLTAEQKVQVGFIQSASSELSEMVDDLLDLAKIEAGRITVSPAWFDMVDFFSALRGMFRPLLEASDVNLIFEAPADLSSLYTDRKRLSQILRNFISNAIKFTPSGQVRVTAEPDGDFIIFSVIDTGIGIAEEFLPALFKDFSQVGSPLQKQYRGTGLGLALSKRIAGVLGGTVGVESKVGVGSTFFVRIPTQLPEEEAITEMKTPITSHG